MEMTPAPKRRRSSSRMRPDLKAAASLRHWCPNIAVALDTDYFNEFSVEEIEGHLERIAGLTRAAPYSFRFSPLSDRTFGLTVVGEDVPGFFAALSGVLASHDLDIKVGRVFSYAPELPEGGQGWPEEQIPAAGKLIDYLVLERPPEAPAAIDAGFRDGLTADLLSVIHPPARARKPKPCVGICSSESGHIWIANP